MTNDTALEAAAKLSASLRERTQLRFSGNCKCGQCMLVPLETITVSADALDFLAEKLRASTLSPDVSGLVERLRNRVLARLALNKNTAKDKRDSSLDNEAADVLTALSLQLAAVEKERDSYAQHSVENSMRAFNWMAAHDALKAGVPYEYPTPEDVPNIVARAETAEASLTAAQEENERLRAVLEPFADVADFMDSETEGFSMDDELWLGISNDGFPPCHIKNFALQLFYTARATLSTPSKGKDKTDE